MLLLCYCCVTAVQALHSAYRHLNSTLHTLLEENKLSGEQRELVCRHLQGALQLQAEL